MSEHKQIKINVSDFNFNATRKKKPTDKTQNTPGIKIKTPTSKPKVDTLKKRTLLKMIRQQQEDRYNKLFGTSKDKSSATNAAAAEAKLPEITEMNTELEKAKEYLNNLKEKQEKSHNGHNATIKHHPSLHTMPSFQVPATNNVHSPIATTIHSAPPKYGCMKNGQLPTYKTFMRTSKNQPIIQIGSPVSSMNYSQPAQNQYHPQPQPQPQQQSNIISNIGLTGPAIASIMANSAPQNGIIRSPVAAPQADIRSNASIIDAKITEGLKRMSELKQSDAILNSIKNKYRPKRMMQRKTVRRTYKIGRSTVLPRIAVLVSNKTIRNNTTTKTQLLKQTSIQDVKKHLIQRGLIRVGCTTPNDVLRKMYESTMLICGDVQNHNADNLLYNFVNGDKEH
jgi:hypothetical protein